MKIILEHAEIVLALTEFVINQGIVTTEKSVAVTLIAGRGSNGHSAELNILLPDARPHPLACLADTPEPLTEASEAPQEDEPVKPVETKSLFG